MDVAKSPTIHESPLAALAREQGVNPAELEKYLKEQSLRGKTIRDLAGDYEGVVALRKLMSLGDIYKPSKEFQDELMGIVTQHVKSPDLDAKERGIWAKIGLEAMKQNQQKQESNLRLMGLATTKAEPNVTVNVSTTIADKVLTIVDPVRGAHSRDEETQELLNGYARQLFNSKRVEDDRVTQGGVSEPLGITQDSGGGSVLDSGVPGNTEREAGPDGNA